MTAQSVLSQDVLFKLRPKKVKNLTSDPGWGPEIMDKDRSGFLNAAPLPKNFRGCIRKGNDVNR
jgi:hypothetical protein